MYESEDKLVSHPDHYMSKSGLETINVIEAFTDGLVGIEASDTANILKYACRWKVKGGVQDLEKILWYTTHLIEHLKKKEKVEPVFTWDDEANTWKKDPNKVHRIKKEREWKRFNKDILKKNPHAAVVNPDLMKGKESADDEPVEPSYGDILMMGYLNDAEAELADNDKAVENFVEAMNKFVESAKALLDSEEKKYRKE